MLVYYGEVADYRQAELIKKLNQTRTNQSPEIQEAFEQMFNKIMGNNDAIK